jgi:mannose/cellobiose epimerase-like protein (N-acyl-D-glucosamine 2-epimerase family)
MKIVAYTYDAAIHCVQCTQRRARQFKFDARLAEHVAPHLRIDEHGIHIGTIDSEGNQLRPVFSDDEIVRAQTHCDDCNHPI